MEQKSTIICPHCGAKLDVTLNELTTEPTPDPTPPHEEKQPLSFEKLLYYFNPVLASRGYHKIEDSMEVYGYLWWMYSYASQRYTNNDWMFSEGCYPLVYNYRGADSTEQVIAFNAMQAWLMAMALSELVPDSGEFSNTQTRLFKTAYEIGGNCSYPLYNGKTLNADPYAMREVAGIIYAICRSDCNIAEHIEVYRSELGGKPIDASCWNDLGYKNEMIADNQGRRGYKTTYLGYCINTDLILPSAPGPRVDGTTVCEQPWPWEEGQSEFLFNIETGNYHMDEIINNAMVKEWNMMSATPLSEWDSYPREKQNRLVNVAAIPPCTYMYMFGAPKKVKFDGIKNKSYDGKITANYYTFSETDEDTGLALDGPFSNLAGIYRYNIPEDQKLARERFIEIVTELADNLRFPTQDPNYGRCRPGCKPTREGGELNPLHGAKENEIYNVDLTTMVADNAQQKVTMARQDGFAQDSPRSYVSGHSAQIWALALLLTQMDEDSTLRPIEWVRKAFEYSINRSVGRFHWNSDCIYGRLFGTMCLPIINAMTGLKDGYKAMKQFVQNPSPEPTPEGDWQANIIIKNLTGTPIQSTGEIRLYVDNHIGVNTYLPGAWEGAGAKYTFNVGETNFSGLDVHCVMNGETTMDDQYDGAKIDDVRFYDYRHYNNIDAGYLATLDTADPRCSPVLRKAGATYVIKITSA